MATQKKKTAKTVAKKVDIYPNRVMFLTIVVGVTTIVLLAVLGVVFS